MPSAAAITHSVKSSREPVRHLPQQPREKTAADDQHQGDEHPDLTHRHRERAQHLAAVHGSRGRDHRRERRHQHEHQHGHQVFDYQPADRDATVHGLELAACFERAQQHDRACDRQGKAEYDIRREIPPPERREAAPSAVATAICTIAPGSAMRRTDRRSWNEKCRPTPNISSMTPISAS